MYYGNIYNTQSPHIKVFKVLNNFKEHKEILKLCDHLRTVDTDHPSFLTPSSFGLNFQHTYPSTPFSQKKEL